MPSHKDVSTVFSRAHGLHAPLVRVEAHLGNGLPAFHLVGLPEAAVRESKQRVRSALETAGFEFPVGRLTVNLSPADIPKEGGRFDLPIAIGVLAATGKLAPASLRDREFYGELSLDGALRETSKLLPALMAGEKQGHELIIPAANAVEARLIGSPLLKLAERLQVVVDGLTGRAQLPWHGAPPGIADPANIAGPAYGAGLADIRGQFAPKRALEIAAAGGHGLLLIGHPGAGKTLLAQCLPGLLPPLSRDEMLEVASLESAAGLPVRATTLRPFRSPQHTASVAALIGGGLRPGELSLAHLGVLFLDELPEFPRNALEALREPLESGVVLVSRLKRTLEHPARFQLVAAMNPCPCGYAGDLRGRCRCTAAQVIRYRNRISGPLIDRIDIHVEMAAVPVEQMIGVAVQSVDTSCEVAARVAAARQRQLARQQKLNARLNAGELDRHCRLGRSCHALLRTAIERLALSARAYHRVLKLARTCADLAAEPDIRPHDVAEAVNLRALDRPIRD